MLEFLCVNIWGPIWLRNLKNTLQKAPNFMQKYAKEKITSVSCCKRTCNNGFWTIFMLHFKKKKNIFGSPSNIFSLQSICNVFITKMVLNIFEETEDVACLVQYFSILPCLNFLSIFWILHMLTSRNTNTAFRFQVGKFWFCPSKVSKIRPPFPPREALIVRTKHYQQKRLASVPKNFHFSELSWRLLFSSSIC